MALTAAQIPVLKAALLASSTISAARGVGDHGAIAIYANTPSATPIYRPAISAAELNTAIVWSEFAALPVSTQNAYFAMLQAGSINATSANIRNGFVTIFGTSASLTALTALATRPATLFETLFTTSGICSCFGQTVTAADVALALNS